MNTTVIEKAFRVTLDGLRVNGPLQQKLRSELANVCGHGPASTNQGMIEIALRCAISITAGNADELDFTNECYRELDRL